MQSLSCNNVNFTVKQNSQTAFKTARTFTFVTLDVMQLVEGAGKLSKWISTQIELSAFFSKTVASSVFLKSVAKEFNNLGKVLDVWDLAKRWHQYMKGEEGGEGSWQARVGLYGVIAYRMLGLARHCIVEHKLYDLNVIMATIGKIPLVGGILVAIPLAAIGTFSLVFDAVVNHAMMQKNKKEKFLDEQIKIRQLIHRMWKCHYIALEKCRFGLTNLDSVYARYDADVEELNKILETSRELDQKPEHERSEIEKARVEVYKLTKLMSAAELKALSDSPEGKSKTASDIWKTLIVKGHHAFVKAQREFATVVKELETAQKQLDLTLMEEQEREKYTDAFKKIENECAVLQTLCSTRKDRLAKTLFNEFTKKEAVQKVISQVSDNTEEVLAQAERELNDAKGKSPTVLNKARETYEKALLIHWLKAHKDLKKAKQNKKLRDVSHTTIKLGARENNKHVGVVVDTERSRVAKAAFKQAESVLNDLETDMNNYLVKQFAADEANSKVKKEDLEQAEKEVSEAELADVTARIAGAKAALHKLQQKDLCREYLEAKAQFETAANRLNDLSPEKIDVALQDAQKADNQDQVKKLQQQLACRKLIHFKDLYNVKKAAFDLKNHINLALDNQVQKWSLLKTYAEWEKEKPRAALIASIIKIIANILFEFILPACTGYVLAPVIKKAVQVLSDSKVVKMITGELITCTNVWKVYAGRYQFEKDSKIKKLLEPKQIQFKDQTINNAITGICDHINKKLNPKEKPKQKSNTGV